MGPGEAHDGSVRKAPARVFRVAAPLAPSRLVGGEKIFPVAPKPLRGAPPPPPFGWSPSPVSLALHGGGEAAAPFLPCASARGGGPSEGRWWGHGP